MPVPPSKQAASQMCSTLVTNLVLLRYHDGVHDLPSRRPSRKLPGPGTRQKLPAYLLEALLAQWATALDAGPLGDAGEAEPARDRKLDEMAAI